MARCVRTFVPQWPRVDGSLQKQMFGCGCWLCGALCGACPAKVLGICVTIAASTLSVLWGVAYAFCTGLGKDLCLTGQSIALACSTVHRRFGKNVTCPGLRMHKQISTVHVSSPVLFMLPVQPACAGWTFAAWHSAISHAVDQARTEGQQHDTENQLFCQQHDHGSYCSWLGRVHVTT